MIDLACILFSSGLCLLVAFRAVQLDRLIPWFGLPGAAAEAGAVPRGTAAQRQARRTRATPRATGAEEPAAASPAPAARPASTGWRARIDAP